MTPKQRELYDWIVAYIGLHGYSPSYSEMRDAVGLRSKAGIHRLVNALAERGYIGHMACRHRSIELRRRPLTPADLEIVA